MATEKTTKTADLTLILAVNPKTISKRFKLEGGRLVKIPGGQLVRGTATRLSLSAAALSVLIRRLTPSQALTLGVTRHETARVVTAEALRTGTGGTDTMPTVARTLEHFHSPTGPGWMLIDHDGTMDPAALMDVLAGVCPDLATAPRVTYASASSYIYRTSDDECLRGLTGHHHLVMAADLRDVPRFLKALSDRLWLAGYGRFDVSKSGALLDRTIVDLAVGGPERLIFSGGANCGPGVDQRRPDPVVFNPEGEPLDTAAACPDLSKKDAAALRKAKDAAAKAIQMRRVRDGWLTGWKT